MVLRPQPSPPYVQIHTCIHELGTVSLTSTGTLKKILVVKWMRNTLFDLSYRFPIHISQWKNTAKRPVWTGPGGICLQWGGQVGEGDRKKDWFYQSQIHWALKPFTKPLTVPQSWPQPSAPAAGAVPWCTLKKMEVGLFSNLLSVRFMVSNMVSQAAWSPSLIREDALF